MIFNKEQYEFTVDLVRGYINYTNSTFHKYDNTDEVHSVVPVGLKRFIYVPDQGIITFSTYSSTANRWSHSDVPVDYLSEYAAQDSLGGPYRTMRKWYQKVEPNKVYEWSNEITTPYLALQNITNAEPSSDFIMRMVFNYGILFEADNSKFNKEKFLEEIFDGYLV